MPFSSITCDRGQNDSLTTILATSISIFICYKSFGICATSDVFAVGEAEKIKACLNFHKKLESCVTLLPPQHSCDICICWVIIIVIIIITENNAACVQEMSSRSLLTRLIFLFGLGWKIGERRASSSSWGATDAREEIFWLWSGVWLCGISWWQHMEVGSQSDLIGISRLTEDVTSDYCIVIFLVRNFCLMYWLYQKVSE